MLLDRQETFNVVTTNNPSVNITGNTSVKGFNFDRINDANNSNNNGWVFSDALSNNQGDSYNYKQELQNFLGALNSNADATHKYLDTDNLDHNAVIFTSSGIGDVIDNGSNNNIRANGSVLVNGDNNNIASNGIVIANGYNNVVRSKQTVYNDRNLDDYVHHEAMYYGNAIIVNGNNQNINK